MALGPAHPKRILTITAGAAVPGGARAVSGVAGRRARFGVRLWRDDRIQVLAVARPVTAALPPEAARHRCIARGGGSRAVRSPLCGWVEAERCCLPEPAVGPASVVIGADPHPVPPKARRLQVARLHASGLKAQPGRTQIACPLGGLRRRIFQGVLLAPIQTPGVRRDRGRARLGRRRWPSGEACRSPGSAE
jgi:hypothetical protein